MPPRALKKLSTLTEVSVTIRTTVMEAWRPEDLSVTLLASKTKQRALQPDELHETSEVNLGLTESPRPYQGTYSDADFH